MPTLTYLTARSPGTQLTGAPQGNWSGGDSFRDNRNARHFVFLLSDTAVDGGVVTAIAGGASLTKTTDQKLLAANLQGVATWVTKQVDGNFTLSGTITLICKVSTNSAGNAQATYHVHAYITQGDSLTLRTTIADNVTSGTPWTSAQTWRAFTFSVAGSGLSGDRIAVEIGANCSPQTLPAPGDNTFAMAWGTTNASDVVQADAVNGTTGAGAAWLSFSDSLTWLANPAPPANDACADATSIASLPFTDGPLDTTQSADPNRTVWYTWTAPANMRVFATVWGGNYSTRLVVYDGGCGGLSLIQASSRIAWAGSSQSTVFLDATFGVTYHFAVESSRATVGENAQLSALNSGGSLTFTLAAHSAPMADDLFIDCQHIAVFRGTTLVNLNSALYGLTPTGNAIDYTLRPMDDLNGGVSTSERLYVGVFGAIPLVEVLDLATLNTGQFFEIDFILGPISGAGHSENISSIVFDASGTIYMGFFGDNYAVVDIVATPPTGNVMHMDAQDADNQPGAPFPAATSLAVAYENGGSDYAELALDQDTIWYTSGGVLIKRYSLTSGQLADFATLPAATGPRPGARTLRLLPPGDGSTGLLVAYGDKVLRLNAAGAVVQTFTPTTFPALAQDLDKVELTMDADTFWVSDQLSCVLWQFDLATGAELAVLDTQLPPGQLSGFSVYLGFRAGNPPGEGPFPPPVPSGPPPPPPPPPPECPGLLGAPRIGL